MDMHARKLVEKDEKRRASMQKVESTDPRTGQPVPLEAPKTFASARAAGSAAVFGTSPRVPLFVVETFLPRATGQCNFLICT